MHAHVHHLGVPSYVSMDVKVHREAMSNRDHMLTLHFYGFYAWSQCSVCMHAHSQFPSMCRQFRRKWRLSLLTCWRANMCSLLCTFWAKSHVSINTLVHTHFDHCAFSVSIWAHNHTVSEYVPLSELCRSSCSHLECPAWLDISVCAHIYTFMQFLSKSVCMHSSSIQAQISKCVHVHICAISEPCYVGISIDMFLHVCNFQIFSYVCKYACFLTHAIFTCSHICQYVFWNLSEFIFWSGY